VLWQYQTIILLSLIILYFSEVNWELCRDSSVDKLHLANQPLFSIQLQLAAQVYILTSIIYPYSLNLIFASFNRYFYVSVDKLWFELYCNMSYRILFHIYYLIDYNIHVLSIPKVNWDCDQKISIILPEASLAYFWFMSIIFKIMDR
jgi:hypothetical protein